MPGTTTVCGFSKKWCLGLIPIVLGAMAFMCCFLYNFWCESIQFTKNADLSSDDDDSIRNVQLGPWYVKATETVRAPGGDGNNVLVRDVCVELPDELDVDSALKTVRAFSIITPVFGGLLVFVIALSNCLYFLSAKQWKIIAIFFIVVLTTFQGLTFLLLQSNACSTNPLIYVVPPDDTTTGTAWETVVNTMYDSTCEWAPGSTANVFSIICWFLAGISMLVLGVPTREPRPPPETQQVTYQKTTNPDGTTTVVETAVVKGTAVP